MLAVGNLLWGTDFRKVVTSIFTTIAAISGAIVAIPPAYSVLEPGLPASHYFVRGQIAPLRLAMDQQAAAIDRQTLFQLNENLARAQTDPAASTSPVVKERIEEIKRHIEETTARIQKGSDGH